jgi:hypothetical protein
MTSDERREQKRATTTMATEATYLFYKYTARNQQQISGVAMPSTKNKRSERPDVCDGDDGPASSKAVMKSKRDSPSNRSNNIDGYRTIVGGVRFRSVLHHKVGLPLALFLYDKDKNDVHVPECFQIKPNLRSFIDGGDGSVKALFESCYKEWIYESLFSKRADETKLTAILTKVMNDSLKTFNLKVSKEKLVPDLPSDGNGRIDILVHRNNDSTPVLLIEAGLDNADWWSKAQQGTIYIPGVINASADPMLLAVLTLKAPRQKIWRSRRFESSRIGVFLVTPKKEEDTIDGHFRIALLWRSSPENVATLSADFGKILSASYLLTRWIDDEKSNSLDDDQKSRTVSGRTKYMYLGPNCCRIENEVRGAYGIHTTLCAVYIPSWCSPILFLLSLFCRYFGSMTLARVTLIADRIFTSTRV